VINLTILLSELFSTKLTKLQQDQLNLFVTDLSSYFESLTTLVTDLYQEKKCFLYSTGKDNYDDFSTDLTNHLAILDYKTRIADHVNTLPHGYVKTVLFKFSNDLHGFIESHIHNILENTLIRHVEAEKLHIAECLRGESFFNLTNLTIPAKTVQYMEKGAKYNPYTKKSNFENLTLFDREFAKIINKLLQWIVPKNKLIESKQIVNGLNDLKQYFLSIGLAQNAALITELVNRYISERKRYRKDLNDGIYKGKTSDLEKSKLNGLFDFDPNVIFLEGDKNVGFVCMTKSDLLDQYDKINKEQCFEQVQLVESEYLTDIAQYIRNAQQFLPNELSHIIPKSCFKHDISHPSLGSLRLMPKILKLKHISPAAVPQLKCRGIKSSMSDPVRCIQLALDHVFNHIIFYQEKHFSTTFGRNSPSVTGVDEAIFRHKKTKIGPFGHSIEVEADFSNLYSFCNMELLKKHVAKGLKLAKITDASKDYIFNLIEVEMTRSYFKEPGGIFRTLMGFSMGDHAAAHGSEVILLSSEIDIYYVLVRVNVINVVKAHDRFRDDIKLHVSGRLDMVLSALKIIIDGYPKEITLNMKTGLITGNFLNIRIYSDPTRDAPYTTILRKQHSRYNIIPPDSNTVECFKKCAGTTYFRLTKTHCSTLEESDRQRGIVKLILKLKGYTDHYIRKMASSGARPPVDLLVKKDKKQFLGTVTFDSLTLNHTRLKRIFRVLHKEKYFLPMSVPDIKLKQYIFTLRKMKCKLGIL
jgi:hypothetical protein